MASNMAVKKENGVYLGALLGERLKDAPWAKDVDCIIPVPLHPSKQAKRGYNQSLLIAKGLSRSLDIPVWHQTLMRVRDTESQTRKTRSERVDNMSGAFRTYR
jgi:predicted amidophosphoribosyltransferase